MQGEPDVNPHRPYREKPVHDVAARARGGAVRAEARQRLAGDHARHAAALELLRPEQRRDLREVHHRPLCPRRRHQAEAVVREGFLGAHGEARLDSGGGDLVERTRAPHVKRRAGALAVGVQVDI